VSLVIRYEGFEVVKKAKKVDLWQKIKYYLSVVDQNKHILYIVAFLFFSFMLVSYATTKRIGRFEKTVIIMSSQIVCKNDGLPKTMHIGYCDSESSCSYKVGSLEQDSCSGLVQIRWSCSASKIVYPIYKMDKQIDATSESVLVNCPVDTPVL
jgi:hypothetical protein